MGQLSDDGAYSASGTLQPTDRLWVVRGTTTYRGFLGDIHPPGISASFGDVGEPALGGLTVRPLVRLVPANYIITGWKLACYPSDTVEIDIRVGAFGAGIPASSIVASAPPAISSGTSNSSTTLTGWSTTVTRGQMISIVLSNVTAAEWVGLLIEAKRN